MNKAKKYSIKKWHLTYIVFGVLTGVGIGWSLDSGGVMIGAGVSAALGGVVGCLIYGSFKRRRLESEEASLSRKT